MSEKTKNGLPETIERMDILEFAAVHYNEQRLVAGLERVAAEREKIAALSAKIDAEEAVIVSEYTRVAQERNVQGKKLEEKYKISGQDSFDIVTGVIKRKGAAE